MKNSLAAMAVVLASGSAYAGFQADYIDITGVGNAIRIDNTANGGINALYAAGHFNFQYDDVGGDRGLGQFSGGTFSTFCIELQTARDAMYEIDQIRNAPNPTPGAVPDYDAVDEAEVAAVISAAVALEWINSDLSAGSNVTNARLAAIQGLIWDAVLDGAVVTANHSGVGTAMSTLSAQIGHVDNPEIFNLQAMVSADSQDQLFIVPLPTAAFAGMLTLAGLGGYKRLNRK